MAQISVHDLWTRFSLPRLPDIKSSFCPRHTSLAHSIPFAFPFGGRAPHSRTTTPTSFPTLPGRLASSSLPSASLPGRAPHSSHPYAVSPPPSGQHLIARIAARLASATLSFSSPLRRSGLVSSSAVSLKCLVFVPHVLFHLLLRRLCSPASLEMQNCDHHWPHLRRNTVETNCMWRGTPVLHNFSRIRTYLGHGFCRIFYLNGLSAEIRNYNCCIFQRGPVVVVLCGVTC